MSSAEGAATDRSNQTETAADGPKTSVGVGSDNSRDLYADLIGYGCPVLLCVPHRHRASCKPTCTQELDQPPGWERSVPDPSVIEGYSPGLHTVALVSGHVLDVIDVDTKNGANVEQVAKTAAAEGVAILGINATPSGGAHLYVASTGIATSNKPSNGIDFRGGCADGSGRGLVYLPGSTRPKYPSAGYSVAMPVRWEALPALDLDEQRDALWRFLSKAMGITPRLSATAAPAAVAGESLPTSMSPPLSELLTDQGPTWQTVKGPSADRSARFHHLVQACKRHGLTQGQAVTAVTPWCNAVGKFVGRVEGEVARSWGKPDQTAEYVESLEAGGQVTTDSTGAMAGAGLAGTASGGTRNADAPDEELTQTNPLRRVVLIPAADIEPLPTTWTWDGRLPTGALGLIAGPEGTGKSTCAYWIAARITRGELPGIHRGTPRDVLIAATEDSWARTIIPRLIAAGADLARVWRVEVTTVLGTGGYLTLPKDVGALAEHVKETGAVLLLLDPIMSRLEPGLDSHKDAETRRALEPIAALADRTGMSVLGLIHFNKSGSADVLNNVMASKAFTAVARSVSTVIRDPNDDTGRTRIFGTPKSNLGRDDLPLLPFQLVEHTFANRDGEAITTSRIKWLAEQQGTIADLMRQARDPGDRSIVAEVADWLAEYLQAQHGSAKRSHIIDAARKERYSEDQLKRAAERLGIVKKRQGFPASSWWELPAEGSGRQSEHSQSTVRGESLTALTTPTGDQSEQLAQSESPREDVPQLGQPAAALCVVCRSAYGLTSGQKVCAHCQRDEERKRRDAALFDPDDTPDW